MFKELGPLLRQRTVVMILTRLEDETIRVNVIPRKLNESENDALTTPLSVAGTAEDLDAQLPFALVQFVGAHLELKNMLESVKEQIAAAAKAAKAEARSKTAPKTAPVRTEPAPVETKKPTDKAPEPAKPLPLKTASLFDVPTPAATPTASLNQSEEDDEPFVEFEDDEPTGETEELDDAA